MPNARLTDISVKGLKAPQTGQLTYWDESVPGFGVRVSQGGSKTFILMHGAKRQRTTIGRYPVISLSDARTAAKRILAERTLTKHLPPSISFEDALTQFFTSHCDQKNRQRTAQETKRLLNRHFKPAWGRQRLADISRHSVAEIVDGLLETPSLANHAFTAVHTFFRWATRRGYLAHSPTEGMQLPTRPKTRERVLRNEELVALWEAADRCGTFGQIIRLLILTGQRRGEVGALRAEFINSDETTILLPPSLTKNHRQHLFPYGKISADIFATLPKKGLLFPARGTKQERSFNGWSKGKQALDKEVAGEERKNALEPWTLHDLRRTFATKLAELRIAPHVIERMLNHKSGTISGVAAIYNRFQYIDEMRGAVNVWERHLHQIVRAKKTRRSRGLATSGSQERLAVR